MNTLTSAPLAPLLTRLFAEAEATTATLQRAVAEVSADRTAVSKPDPSDYRAFYARLKHAHLAVSPETGRLLYMLARAAKASSMVEFGTSFGISTLHMAAALKDNGGGHLIGSEFEPSKAAQARVNFKLAALDDLIEIREGDALQSLARELPEVIDFVLLDGAKSLYGPVLSLLEPRLRSGALIVADNADRTPEYLARVRAVDAGYLSVPFGTDVEVSMRL